jgi:hypothetical protein
MGRAKKERSGREMRASIMFDIVALFLNLQILLAIVIIHLFFLLN